MGRHLLIWLLVCAFVLRQQLTGLPLFASGVQYFEVSPFRALTLSLSILTALICRLRRNQYWMIIGLFTYFISFEVLSVINIHFAKTSLSQVQLETLEIRTLSAPARMLSQYRTEVLIQTDDIPEAQQIWVVLPPEILDELKREPLPRRTFWADYYPGALGKPFLKNWKLREKSQWDLLDPVLKQPCNSPEDCDGKLAFMISKNSDREEIRKFISANKIDINRVILPPVKSSALHLALRYKRFDVAKVLIEMGANVNLQDSNGDTALHYASREGQLELLHLMLQKGGNKNIQNIFGEKP